MDAFWTVLWFVSWPVLAWWMVIQERKRIARERKRMTKSADEFMDAVIDFLGQDKELVDDVTRRLVG